MQLMATLRTSVNIAVATALLGMSSLASAERIEETPSAGAMVADAVLARPLYFVLSQAGALIYGATLPFTLLGGNADQAAETLVVTPLQAAFVRCLGCGNIENEVGSLNEGDGKRIRHFVMLSGGVSQEKSFVGEKFMSGGLYLGTHFSLLDNSRFDVMLGGRQLMASEKDVGDESLNSLEIVSRFGKAVNGWLELSGKLGLSRWKYKVDSDVDTTGISDIKASSVDFFWGVGAAAQVSGNWRVGLDYTRYDLTVEDNITLSGVAATDADALAFQARLADGVDTNLELLDLNITYMF